MSGEEKILLCRTLNITKLDRINKKQVIKKTRTPSTSYDLSFADYETLPPLFGLHLISNFSDMFWSAFAYSGVGIS